MTQMTLSNSMRPVGHLSKMRSRDDVNPLGALALVATLCGAIFWSTQADAAAPTIEIEEAADLSVTVRITSEKAPTFQIYEARSAQNQGPSYVIELPGTTLAAAPLAHPSAVVFHSARAVGAKARTSAHLEVNFFAGVDYDAKTQGKTLVITFAPFDDRATLLARATTRKNAQREKDAAVAEAAKKAAEQVRLAQLEKERQEQERARVAALEVARKEAAAKEAERLLAEKRAQEEAKRVAALEQKRQAELELARKREEEARRVAKLEEERKQKEALRLEQERARKAEEERRLAALAAEKERQRQEALEAQRKREEEAKQLAARKLEEERQRKAEAEKQRLAALEKERQRKEAEAAQKLEEQRRKEAERLAALEKERIRKAEQAAALAAKQEAEKQKALALENERRRQAEAAEKLAQERQRQEAAERERIALEQRRQQELQAEREREAQERARLAAEQQRRQQEEQRRLAEVRAREEQKARLAEQRRREAKELEQQRAPSAGGRRIEVASASRNGFGFGGTQSVDLGGKSGLYQLASAPRVREDAFGGGDDESDGPVGVLSRVTVRRDAASKSSVGIRVDGGARYALSRRSTNELVITLFDTRAQSLAVRRILDARDLRTSILRVLPHVEEDARNRVELVIELRGSGAARITEENEMLWLHVES